MRRRVKWLLPLLPFLLLGLAHADRDADSIGNWRNASRALVGLAPDPAVPPDAVVQVYGARAVRWRGYFGIHTWIAAKRSNAPAFTVYEVTGFRVRSGGSAVTISQRAPDGRWFGSAPRLLADVRRPGVDPLIERIEDAVAAYPYDAPLQRPRLGMRPPRTASSPRSPAQNSFTDGPFRPLARFEVSRLTAASRLA